MNAIVENLFKGYFDQYPYDCKIVGVDVETTGLADDSRIVELAAVGFEFDGIDLNVVKFQSFVNPEMHIPEEVTKIHGITDEMVAEAPKAEEVFEKFKQFLLGATTLVAHNADYDRKMLNNNFIRVGIPFIFESKFKCTLQLAKRSHLNLPNYKLGEVADHFGYKNENAHRAYDDALCALYVWGRLNLL